LKGEEKDLETQYIKLSFAASPDRERGRNIIGG